MKLNNFSYGANGGKRKKSRPPIQMSWIRSRSGKELLLCGGFTYYLQLKQKKRDRWACTSLGGLRHCKARIMMTKDRKIANLPSEPHTHSPPQLVTRNGVCYKI
ncbi:FLYWCH zinc finger domain-containing protein [Phthorimaea operculella]|nr:FLYWCH zinc finger domain-containing protein [Phthorimaea operculella]